MKVSISINVVEESKGHWLASGDMRLERTIGVGDFVTDHWGSTPEIAKGGCLRVLVKILQEETSRLDPHFKAKCDT